MTPVDWTPTYLARLPVRWEAGIGDCTSGALCYAMELRAILQGLPVVQLSQLFMQYNQRVMDGTINTTNVGSNMGSAMIVASTIGTCTESLWPITITYGPDTAATGVTDYNAIIAGINRAPSAAAVADAHNHKLGTTGTVSYHGVADMATQVQASITAGFPVIFVTTDHELCAWGFNATGLIGLDVRSQSSTPYQLSYDAVFADNPGAMISVLSVISTAQPTDTRNVTTTTVSDATFAITGGNNPTGTVTVVATYSGDANNQPSTSTPLIRSVGTAPPPPPAPSGGITPGVGTLTDATGAIWNIGTNQNVYETIDGVVNGSPGTGQQAQRMTLVNGVAAAQDPVYGAWRLFDRPNNRWVTTTTPPGL